TIQVGSNATDTVNLKIAALNLVPVSGTASVGTPAGLSTALVAGHALVGTSRTISAEDVAFGATMGAAALTTADIGTSVTLAVGNTFYVPAGDTDVAGGINISTAANATAALATLETAMTAVSTVRANLGAGQSRL